MIKLFNSDSLEALKGMEDNQFDLAIVDPPYGIGRSKGIGKRNNEFVYTKYEDKKWDKNTPTKEYFKELKRVSKNQIIWGANYFGIPFDKMIVWDKQIGDNDFAMAEIASHSFTSSTKICSFFSGANRNGKNTTRIHPTQKPVKLYKWLLKNYGYNKDGSKRTILDTHFGSLSIGIACADLGFDLDAYEIDKDYFNSAVKRLQNHINQLDAFVPVPEILVNGKPINEYIDEVI